MVWQEVPLDRIYFDEDTGVPGTTWPIGTASVPSDVIADIITMCVARNLHQIQVRGALTLTDTMEHYCFFGYEHEDIADLVSLGGQDVDGSHMEGLIVTGAQGGAGFLSLVRCIVNTLTLFQGQMNRCNFYAGTCSFKDTGYIDLIDCDSIYGAVTITVQAPTRASIKNWRGNLVLTAQDGGTCYVRGYKGTLEIDAMTAGTLSIYANGADITINADCTGGTINIYGSATVTNNALGATVNDYTEQDDRAEQTAELEAADMSLITAFGSGSLANTGEATLCSLDAMGGTKKDAKVTVYLDAATVGNIEECWYLTSIAAPTTFVKKFPILAAHNPGAAAVLQREFGDVPEGLQLQYRIDSGANNDSGVDYECELTYLS